MGELIFTLPCETNLPESSLIESVKRQTNAHHDEIADGQKNQRFENHKIAKPID